MITIDQLFDKIILRSGQFILHKNNVELDVDNFRNLVEDAMEVYSDFAPYDKEYTIDFRTSPSFIFTENFDTEIGRPLDWVSKADPIRSIGTPYSSHPFGAHGNPSSGLYQSKYLSEPIEAPFHFNKDTKTLTVGYRGFYSVVGVYRHKIKEVDNLDGTFTYSIPTLSTSDQLFIQLCQGLFLKGIGRSRRAFTLNDLPVLMDAGEIVSEGKEMYNEAFEKLENKQKFHLAWGG